MEITGLFLLLLGAALKSGNNVLMKKMTQEFASIKEILTAHIFTAIGLLILILANIHVGYKQNLETMASSTFWIALLPTMLLNIVIMYGNMYALSKADVSLIGPIIATTPLIVLIPSGLILQEYPGTLGYIGLICCAVGLYVFAYKEHIFITREDEKNGIEWQPPQFLKNFPVTAKILAPLLMLTKNDGVKIAILTACCGAFAIVFDKKSTLLASTPLLPLGIIMTFVGSVGLIKNLLKSKKNNFTIGIMEINTSIILLAYILTTLFDSIYAQLVILISLLGIIIIFIKDFSFLKVPVKIVVLSSTVLSLFWFPFYYGQAAYVGSLKRLEVVFDLVFGYYILKEKNVKQRIPGALLMMLGAICITLD